MDVLSELYAALPRLLPALIVLLLALLGLRLADWLLLRRSERPGEGRLLRQVLMLALTGVAIIAFVLALPIAESTRNQLLGLLGLLLTAVVALSSTTFVSNAMAGLMLRSVRSFRSGDFVRVGEHFGRVSERGLFHTEIQTEDRDLVTLPNLYLVSQPITVVRASGTIVSTTVSLGYETPHGKLEALLAEAALVAGLQEPFVQVLELANFSVNYRVAGFLGEVKQLLSSRSQLRVAVLDVLHGAGIEIVSPTFMNQRPLARGERAIPSPDSAAPAAPESVAAAAPEDLIFDKAERAQEREELRREQAQLEREALEFGQKLQEAPESERPPLQAEIDQRRARSAQIAELLSDASD